MRILMFTNTFTPHVGGVARSVEQFSSAFRRLGHEVRIVAPVFPNTPDHEPDVIRIPAVQKFNGTDFSVPVPIPGFLSNEMAVFDPEIIHTHHPFLLGDTALRASALYDVPIVFTHHTQYERYTHYVPGDSELLKHFVVDLAVGFCNLCDRVIAPSETIKRRLEFHGVSTQIEEIPTGVDFDLFSGGDGKSVRAQLGISDNAFLVGHVGRLAPEKGLGFLASTVSKFLQSCPNAHFLVAGTGPSETIIQHIFQAAGLRDRLHMLGTLGRSELADVYASMDVFAFASQSETQGMVLTEAMAARTPVVAVDASGVREVLRNGINGIQVSTEDEPSFIHALQQLYDMPDDQRHTLSLGALKTAEEFSMDNTANLALALYESLIRAGRSASAPHDVWSSARRRIEEEWKIWSNVAHAASRAFQETRGEIHSWS